MQLLLFSATFNDKVRSFATKIAPSANTVLVPKESLSLDVISQHNVRCPTREDKVKARRTSLSVSLCAVPVSHSAAACLSAVPPFLRPQAIHPPSNLPQHLHTPINPKLTLPAPTQKPLPTPP